MLRLGSVFFLIITTTGYYQKQQRRPIGRLFNYVGCPRILPFTVAGGRTLHKPDSALLVALTVINQVVVSLLLHPNPYAASSRQLPHETAFPCPLLPSEAYPSSHHCEHDHLILKRRVGP